MTSASEIQLDSAFGPLEEDLFAEIEEQQETGGTLFESVSPGDGNKNENLSVDFTTAANYQLFRESRLGSSPLLAMFFFSGHVPTRTVASVKNHWAVKHGPNRWLSADYWEHLIDGEFHRAMQRKMKWLMLRLSLEYMILNLVFAAIYLHKDCLRSPEAYP